MPVWIVPALAAVASALGIAGGVKGLVDQFKRNKREAKARGGESPVVFSNEQLSALKRLPEKEQKEISQLIDYISADPDTFFGELEELDKSGLLKEVEQQLPTQQQLGFPQSAQDTISQLLQGTDFAPQEEYARRQFSEQTIPQLAERFAGQNALKSSGFQGQLGRAASDLESKLAALRSEYGLKRANVLGPLQQKQQALDLGQAQAARQLGLAERGQRFGEQLNLANLGLQERAQELQRRGLGVSVLPSLFGNASYQFMPNQQRPGMGEYLLGAGGALGGMAANLYGQNQLFDLLKNLQPKQPGVGGGG